MRCPAAAPGVPAGISGAGRLTITGSRIRAAK
jgi:hypothetical protein